MSGITVVRRQRWGRIPPPPEKANGLGRGSIYNLAKKHRKLLRKYGSATLLDFDLLDEIIAEMPIADIGTESDSEDAA